MRTEATEAPLEIPRGDAAIGSTSISMETIGRSRHQCGICSRSFSRLEHLQRHSKIHANSRPFVCRFCRQAFSRKDALRRHERARHDPDSRHGGKTPSLRRACIGCGIARVSCPGGLPCSNCQYKQLQCVYVPRKQKGYTSQRARESSRDQEHDGSEYSPGDNASDNPDWMPDEDVEGIQIADQAASTLTAMNWLPFDCNYVAEVPPGEITSPESNRTASRAAATSLVETGGEDQAETPPQGSETLASLIASMGRASQPFGKRFSRRAMSDADHNPVGSLYSDGAGGRTSQAERAMQIQRAQREVSLSASSTSSIATPRSECSWMHALESGLQASSPAENGLLYRIPDRIYNDVKAKVDARVPFCSANSSFFLSGRSFPGKETLDVFVRSYFDHFHPICPFLDLPLLNMPVWGWSLCLAAAAIGCRYSNSPQKDICADALSVVLRETMIYELQCAQADFTLSYAQALLLNTLALCQSGDTNVMAMGEEAISSVMNWCRRFCLFQEPDGKIQQSIQIEGDTNQMWTAWRCREMRRRTGFFAWMLDIALSTTRCGPSVLNLQSLDLLIPSDEMLWEADSSLAWHRAYRSRRIERPDVDDFNAEEKSRPSLGKVCTRLYDDLQLVDGLSQFASTACIYALFHRHWDMIRLYQAGFFGTGWERKENTSRNQMIASYPAAVPTFTSWRNKACDYMDVLHWEALGISAKAGGLEGPLFLQLHLARLILLTPVKELFTLAEELISTDFFVQLPHNVAWQRANLERSKQFVLTWAQRDRYKARLAVVHAGATFWHVRRYASDSFVQPFTVYLAAIVLYSYAKASVDQQPSLESRNSRTNRSYEGDKQSRVDGNNDPRVHSLAENIAIRDGEVLLGTETRPFLPRRTSRMPTYYYIDRPVDDELVQHFVRDDEKSITLCAEGIENLCSSEGVKQILLEAATLLTAGDVVWPIAQNYAATLRAMSADRTEDGAPD